MQKSLGKYLVFVLFIMVDAGRLFYCNAQAEQAKLKEQFNAYGQAAFQEKIYLHTDKNFYVAGEICWFKMYNVDAVFNRPLGISKLAYIEILDKNNKPVLQSKAALKEGTGNGSLQLPATMLSGKYLLRAYTNWMKNFDAGYFFEKQITVVNTRRIYTDSTPAPKKNYDAQFFPEGGNLVTGIQSKIAFRIVDNNGKGVACTGSVLNEKSEAVVSFSTQQFGMGSFLLTPGAGQHYTAIIKLPDSSKLTQEIPNAYANGYSMRVTKANKQELSVSIQATGANNASPVYLFVHTRGAMKYSAVAELHDGRAVFTTDIDKLGDGISQLTVFNANRQPVCERLFFKKPLNGFELHASTDQQVYDQRKKISVHLFAQGQDNKPVIANMSMAVFRIDSLTQPEEMDISNYLWLNADLNGSVESPGYYFSTDPGAEEAADNLMLTQGWRRFKWADVLANAQPSFHFVPEYKGHIVKGRVVDNNGMPAKNIEAFLSVPGTQTQFRDAFSDDSGYVKFEMSNFYGNDEIVLQTTGQEDGVRHVEIENPYAEKFSTTRIPAFSLPDTTEEELLADKHLSVQVQNTYLADRLKQVSWPDVDSTAFYYKADQSYLLDDYVRFTTIEEVLREYVPDVNVRKTGGKFVLPVFDNIRREFFKTTPLLLLDGVPVMDANKIMQYDPLKIRKLDVMARMYFYGNMFFGGIVNFITYHGDMPGFELDPHATVIDYGTLQMQREFFAPRYETEQAVNSRLPDFRNLLYWSPSITTNNAGRNDTFFYSSDIPGRFAVVTQGLTADGHTASSTNYFEVKPKEAVATIK